MLDGTRFPSKKALAERSRESVAHTKCCFGKVSFTAARNEFTREGTTAKVWEHCSDAHSRAGGCGEREKNEQTFPPALRGYKDVLHFSGNSQLGVAFTFCIRSFIFEMMLDISRTVSIASLHRERN